MIHEIKVPEVSEGVTEGIVAAIAVAVGDAVEADQTLLELETDKAVVEIPTSHAGTVKEIKVAEGDTVKIGAVIVLVEGAEVSEPEGEETATEEPPAVTGPEEPAAEPERVEEQPVPEARSEEPEAYRPAGANVDAVDLGTVRRGDDVAPAAPSVRRKARELGVDIYQVQGTGPGGRISQEDVRRYVKQTMERLRSGAGVAPVGKPLPDFSRWGEVRSEPLSGVRQVTADAMSNAWSNIPMVAQQGRARITEFEKFRKEFNSQADGATRLTMTAVLVKICAAALRQFPQFNSSLDAANKQLIFKEYAHIGVAVDTPAGLLVPVLRDADKKDIETLAVELNELATRARERKLKPEEMEGGCFTISNLGGIGREPFTPIVYAPQVAILGVARGRHEPVWNGQDFVPELVLPLTLTYDHRVIDGADGARFMTWICQAIEYPLQLLMKR